MSVTCANRVPESFRLDDTPTGELLIGSSQRDCALVVPHFSVAARHAVLSPVSGVWAVRPLPGPHVTSINDHPLDGAEYPLTPGDRLQVGELAYHLDGDAILLRESVPDGPGVEVRGLGFSRPSTSRRLWLRRSRTMIFDGFDCVLEPSCLHCLIGESGSGKTTLMRLLATLEAPDSGTISFDGAMLDPSRRSAIAYLPQDDALYPELTVEETLSHYAAIRRSHNPRPLITRILGDLQLEEKRLARIADLSGGQRKRVSIGIEFLHRPRLFLLDEPTSGLDPINQQIIYHILRGLTQIGSTVLVTTHRHSELECCDRVIDLGQDATAKLGSAET